MEKGTQACSNELPNKIKIISLLKGNNKQLRNAAKKYMIYQFLYIGIELGPYSHLQKLQQFLSKILI